MIHGAIVRVVASCNEQVLCERGHELLIARRRGGVSATVLFVLGLLAFLFGVNGLVQLVAAIGGGAPWQLPLALLAATALFAVGLVAAVRKRRRDAGAPPEPELVFDRQRGVLCDVHGRVLAPLAQVRFERQFQLGSSSRALACLWPGGSQVIARGNPFGESVDGIEDVLARVRG